MSETMRFRASFAMLGTALAGCAVVEVSTTEQAGETLQGETLQGETLQGETLQGMSMQGIRLQGATQYGVALTHVQVDRGELVAQRGTDVVRGISLVDAQFIADVKSTGATATGVVNYRITDIVSEDPEYDPTHTGHTFLYTLEQWVGDTSTWQPACPADADGRRVAIPLAAVWDGQGGRGASNTQFTFACTTGVIAKCYRWGYRPWVTGYGDLVAMHQTCTRLARADYCGIGKSHTHDNTKINVWDRLPPPGPIQRHGLVTPPGMTFEAGWNTGGAVCLSRARWLLNDGPDIAALCPQRLVPPGAGETVCESLPEALGYDPNAKMFNESYLLNVKL